MKPVSHSTKCTCGARWSRPPSWWSYDDMRRVVAATLCRATARFTKPVDTIQVLSLHAFSCISVCSPSVTMTALHVPSARARPQVFLSTREAVSEERFVAVLGDVHLHCCSFFVVRHGGHVHRDVICFLFLRFAVTHSFSILFFFSFDVSFDPFSLVSRRSDHKGLDSAGSL